MLEKMLFLFFGQAVIFWHCWYHSCRFVQEIYHQDIETEASLC